ncbi:hypothetical protein ACOSQ4_010730 [Xanthoceras sorbifolium]
MVVDEENGKKFDDDGELCAAEELKKFVKVNSNAAIDISRGMVGLGWVVRDSEGFVLLSAVKPVMGGFSLEVAEVLAVLTALQVARDSGFNRVILDMDASTIVKLVNDATLPLSELGFIIHDIRLFFQDKNFLICVRHVRRSANRVAHCLTKFALSVGQQLVWLEDFPSCVGDLTSDDSRSIYI